MGVIGGGGESSWIRGLHGAADADPTGGGGAADAAAAGVAGAVRRAAGAGLARLPFRRGARIREIGPKRSKLPEPSGVVVHPERGTVFVVGDRGHIAELSPDGEVLQKRRLKHHPDLEGVTVGPGGLVYAVVETPPKILEIDPDTLEVRRSFKVKRKVDGKKVIAKHDNEGLEGITYSAKEKAFFAVNQSRPPVIVRLDLPLGDPDGGKARIAEVIDLRDVVTEEASDVTIDPETGHFLVTEARGGKNLPGASWGRGVLHELSRDGTLLATHHLPGKRPEGLAFDAEGRAFIAQDKGRLLRVDP